MKEDEGRLGVKNSSQGESGRKRKKRVEEEYIDQTLGCIKNLGYMLFYKLIKE